MRHALTAAALGGLALACETDWDCSLNGVCDATSGVCECDAPAHHVLVSVAS